MIMEMEDQSKISVINSPCNTINLIFEFTEAEPQLVTDNEDGSRLEGTGNQIVQVAFRSSLSDDNSDVTSEKSSREGSGFLSSDIVTHQPKSSNVVGKIKRFLIGRNSQESSSIETSIFNAEQSSTAIPPQALISNSKETSVLNMLHSSTSNSLPKATLSRNLTPSTTMSFLDDVVVARPLNFQIQKGVNCKKKNSDKRQSREPTVVKTVSNNQQSTLNFPNGVVVERPLNFQTERQDISEEKISYKRQPREPAVVKTVPNNQQSTANFPNGIVVARPLNFQIQRQDICEEKISYKRRPREPTVVKTVPNNQQSTMNFPNGVVIARPLNFQIERQDICEEKISFKRQPREPAVVKTVPNNQQSTVNFPNGVVVARPPNFQIERQDICEEKISFNRQPRELAVVKTVPNNQQSTMNFPNGIVVARPLNFQIQRQDICEDKISYKRQPRELIMVKTVPNNNNKRETFVCEENISNKRQRQEPVEAKTVASNNSHETIEATSSQCSQMTSSTKLALLNFLKKKSPSSSAVEDVENERINSDPGEQTVSAVQKERSDVEREGSCSDEMHNCENEEEQISIVTVHHEIVSTVEFGNTNLAQDDQNADKTPHEQGSLIETQSDSTNQLDVVILNAENNEEHREEDSNAQFLPKEVDDTTANVVLCEKSAPIILEIDVVVHPSLLQPTEESKNTNKIGK